MDVDILEDGEGKYYINELQAFFGSYLDYQMMIDGRHGRYVWRDGDFHFEEGLPYEDILIHIKTMLRVKKISFVPECLYYYRKDNENSATFNPLTHKKIFSIIDMVEEFLKENNF